MWHIKFCPLYAQYFNTSENRLRMVVNVSSCMLCSLRALYMRSIAVSRTLKRMLPGVRSMSNQAEAAAGWGSVSRRFQQVPGGFRRFQEVPGGSRMGVGVQEVPGAEAGGRGELVAVGWSGVGGHQSATLPGSTGSVPGVAGSRVPDVAGSRVPDVTGSRVPDVYGSRVPDVAGSRVPDVAGSRVPDVAGSRVPDVAGSRVPDVAGSRVPDVAGSRVPDVAGSRVPDVSGSREPDVAGSRVPDVAGSRGRHATKQSEPRPHKTHMPYTALPHAMPYTVLPYAMPYTVLPHAMPTPRSLMP